MYNFARAAALAGIALVAVAYPVRAQSMLERPPNLSGNWVGTSGTVYFNFMHRFSTTSAPERKVSNLPTFTLAVGLPSRLLIGANYATNSRLAPRYPNEWEFFVRHTLLQQEDGSPLDLGGQVGYNLAAEGVDGEVTLARKQGPIRLIGAARIMSDPFEAGRTQFAAAAGMTVRLNRYFAVAGDVARLLNRPSEESTAWSAGLHVALPHTPHTLSIHAANTEVATLQGASRGSSRARYGFEFTVPITLRRWFGGGPPSAPVAAESTPSDPAAPDDVVVSAVMKDFSFSPANIEVAPGTVIEWRNEDPVAHTVTAQDDAFDSGLVDTGAAWRRRFDEPGTYRLYCVPHPFMTAVVVVRQQ